MTYPKVIFTSNKTLDSIAGKQGQFLVCRDTERVYIDVTDNKRLDISGKIFNDIMSNIDMSETIKDFDINGQTITITLGDGTVKTFTTQDNDTTYGLATASADGLMSSADFNKLNKATQDINTLNIKITNIENNIPVIPESLPANGGNAETAEKLKEYTVKHPAAGNGKPFWVKFAESNFSSSNPTVLIKCLCRDYHAYKGSYPNYSDEFYGCYDILFRVNNANQFERAEIQWEYLSSTVNPNDIVIAYYIDENNIYHVACFINLAVSWDGMVSTIVSSYIVDGGQFNLLNSNVGVEEIPAEYTTIIPSVVMPLKGISDQFADLKAYIGYTDSDIYGLEADFENNRFTRLAGAVGKTAGADFDSVNAFGGRKRCTLHDDGTVNKYYPDEDSNDGMDSPNELRQSVMVEQPKFYYKVVPLKTEKIDGVDGYHLRKARYYISDTPKPGFKVHPAFIQNGVEVDKIYLSAYEGSLGRGNAYYLNDEQIAVFDTDVLCSIPNAKPASGTTQALTRANARKLAQNRGAGWGITTIQTLSATQLLFAIEYATFNSQTAIGNGVVNATETIRTGSTSSLGNASGSVESGGVSYRGEENLWGNINTFIDGYDPIGDSTHIISTISSNDKIKMYSLKKNGYISSFNYNPDLDWCFIPCDKTGNSSLPVGDMAYGQTTAIGKIVPVFGGDWSHDSFNGLFCLYTVWEYVNHRNTNGVRLIYIPTEVTAND